MQGLISLSLSLSFLTDSSVQTFQVGNKEEFPALLHPLGKIFFFCYDFKTLNTNVDVSPYLFKLSLLKIICR